MKKKLFMISLVLISCANIQAMDGNERQRLIDEHQKDNPVHKITFPIGNPPPYQEASAPPVDLEQGNINGSGRRILDDPNPQANQVMDESDGMTYGQYWKAYNIPQSEQYRSKNLLLQYVQERQDKAVAQCCENCLCTTCCWACGLGAIAGFITGIVYLAEYTNSCDYNPYQTKCYPDPDFPGNATLVFNVTQLAKNKLE
jgi:hypothetical protein